VVAEAAVAVAATTTTMTTIMLTKVIGTFGPVLEESLTPMDTVSHTDSKLKKITHLIIALDNAKDMM